MHGRRLRGDCPPKFEMGPWGTAHASVPTIFWEVLLLDVGQTKNWLKKGVKEELFFGQEKGHMLYISFQTDKIVIKKVIRNLGRLNENLFLKKVIWSPKFFPIPPKLGAKFPPMFEYETHAWLYKKYTSHCFRTYAYGPFRLYILGVIHLWRPQKNYVFDPSPLCPHGPDPLLPCGRPHAVDVKYTPLS